MKLLLVEDNPADARLIREMLKEAPPGTFKLEQVDALQAAQQRLREESFDAVLLDLGLPDSQGLATLQQALLTKDEFPFVILTGFDDQATALEAMRSGAEDYLVKSRVNSELLIRTIQHAVERFRVREALRESEARFRRLAENAQDIIYRYRFQPTRGFDYVSPAATAITGYTPEEHYANPDLGLEIIHPGDRVLIDRYLHGEGRYKEPLVLRWVRKDGAVIWVEQINVPIRDATGNLTALEGIARDITERKRMEEEMLLLQTLTLAIAEAPDFESVLQVTVQRVCEASGWALGESWVPRPDGSALVFGKAWHAAIENAGSFIEANQQISFPPEYGLPGRVWASKKPEWVPDISINRDVYVRAEAAAVIGLKVAVGVPLVAEGEVLAVLVFYMLHEREENRRMVQFIAAVSAQLGLAIRRKQAEAALRESEERFRSLIENASDVITIVSGEGIILYQSPSSGRVLGYPPEQMVGKSAFEFIHPEDAGKVGAALARAVQNPAEPTPADFRFRHQNGSWLILESIGKRRFNAPGAPSVVFTSRDVTERLSLEAQLRQAQKMEAIGQLAGGVAHDFNNLLMIIRGNVELLLTDKENLGEESLHWLKEALGATERAANLNYQLLAFSRKQVLQTRVLNLNELFANLTKMLRRIIGEDISVQCGLASRLPPVQVDPGMMEQVLMNLAVNARDAMPKGGQLLINTEVAAIDETYAREHAEAREGEFVCLSVRDTGCGMMPEVAARIFEPFFTTKDVGKGTGLGLATVYGIVKQHQGWIEVASQMGQGATFKVFLPASPVPAETLDEETLQPKVRGGSETILLVEDEEAVRNLTRRILEDYGYRVLEAASGPAALAVWEQRAQEIDLLLTDVIMPDGLTGGELAEQLRARRPGLRVVLSSGYSPEVAGKDLRREERRYFLQKPYSTGKLAQTVRDCLDGM